MEQSDLYQVPHMKREKGGCLLGPPPPSRARSWWPRTRDHLWSWSYLYFFLALVVLIHPYIREQLFGTGTIVWKRPVPDGAEYWTEWLDVCNT